MKKNKLLVIILISVILLISIIAAFLFLATDMFKSKKKIFNNYLEQAKMGSIINLSGYDNYAERILKESHTNEGKITIVSDELNIDEEIEFSTKTNKESDMASGKIVFSQDGGQKINIEYLKNEELYGVKCIYKQYLALVNNNLKEFASKIGLDEDDVPDKIEINIDDYLNQNSNGIEEEFNAVVNKYLKLVISKMPEKNYSKISKEKIEVQGKSIEADGYKLTINENDFLNIVKEIVKTAKDDQELYNLINQLRKISQEESYNYEEYQDFIANLETELNQTENSENDKMNLTLSVYKQGDKLVKFYTKLEVAEEGTDSYMYMDFAIENNSTIKANYVLNANNDIYSELSAKREINLVINKTETNDKENLEISYKIKTNDEETSSVNITTSLSNSNSDNVEMDMKLDIYSDYLNANIEISNNTVFDENIEVQEFSEVDYVLLSDYSEEQISKILNDLKKKISKQIDINRTVIGSILNNYYSLFNTMQSAAENTRKAQQEEDLISRASQEADQQVISIFNAQFVAYEGEQRGSSVKALINAVKTSNQINANHTIDIDYGIEDIESSSTYNISLEYDGEGYVNRINIEEQ